MTLYLNVVPGLVVNPAVIGSPRGGDELPFMATENILMAAVRAGGDRQDLHERIRSGSIAASARLKEGGEGRNDLIDRLKADPAFAKVDLSAVLDPSGFVGRAPEQVESFVAGEIEPIRRRHPDALRQRRDVDV